MVFLRGVVVWIRMSKVPLRVVTGSGREKLAGTASSVGSFKRAPLQCIGVVLKLDV